MLRSEIHQRLNKILEEYRENIVKNLDKDYSVRTRFADRVSDKVAAFGGSWRFILIFSAFLIVWMVWNLVPGPFYFDPIPFILLNLVLSFLAGFQAPFIMMAQNRHAIRDKVEADIDFAINYKSELEVENMQVRLRVIEGKLDKFQQSLEEIRILVVSRK